MARLPKLPDLLGCCCGFSRDYAYQYRINIGNEGRTFWSTTIGLDKYDSGVKKYGGDLPYLQSILDEQTEGSPSGHYSLSIIKEDIYGTYNRTLMAPTDDDGNITSVYKVIAPTLENYQ